MSGVEELGEGTPASAETTDPYVRYIRRFFARWAPVYDWFAFSIGWFYRTTVRRIAPRPGMTVLDLCTGTGEIAHRCAAAGAVVTGIDLSPEMLARARRKLESRGLEAALEIADARRLDFEDGAFDVVVISFGLHDMPREVRIEVLREARRMAGERLVIADYDVSPDRFGSAFWRAVIDRFESPYFKSFAATGALPLFEEAGLGTPRVTMLFPAFAVFETSVQRPDASR